jgi:Ca2+-binding RTX toxin-like protein
MPRRTRPAWTARTALAALLVCVAAAEARDIRGTPRDDRLQGTSQPDRLAGRNGDDRLHGRGGADRVRGDAGDDVLYGGSAPDRLDGGPGGDVLTGGPSGDHLNGGPGNDVIVAGAGRDQVRAGPGDDRIQIGDTPGLIDALDCGPGEDVAVLDESDSSRQGLARIRNCEALVPESEANPALLAQFDVPPF